MTEPIPMVINGTEILPGQRTTVMLPMPKLYDWTPLTMPVHVIRGKVSGPILVITAAIHGDEVNGIQIIRQLLKKPIIKKISGTIIAVPIVNVYGFLNQERYLMDRRDLNRCFPGIKKGSLASRLAHLLTKEIISKATHIVDLHTGSLHRSNLPQIRTNLDVEENERLAKSFNVPVILHASLRDGSLRQYAHEQSIPFLLYEAGESLRFDDLSIKTGVKGLLGVMHALDMIPINKVPAKKIKSEIARSSYWVRSPYSGILCEVKALGRRVSKGDLLAKIANPTGTQEYRLTSPISGIIIGKSNLPMAHQGAALFNIASFKKLNLVEEQIETLQEGYDNTYDNI